MTLPYPKITAHNNFKVFAYPAVATPSGSTRVGPNVFLGTFPNTMNAPIVDGWGFGDRCAYNCAYWYWMKQGKIAVLFCLQKTAGYHSADGSTVGINDKYGVEQKPQTKPPLPAPSYHQNSKPEGLMNSRIVIKDGGVQVAKLELPATAPENPAAWWEIEDDEISADSIVAEAYLGEDVVLTLSVIRQMQNSGAYIIDPLSVERF